MRSKVGSAVRLGLTVANSAAPPSLSLVVTGDPSSTAPYAVEAQTNRTGVRVRF
jgi:hypothetical protein